MDAIWGWIFFIDPNYTSVLSIAFTINISEGLWQIQYQKAVEYVKEQMKIVVTSVHEDMLSGLNDIKDEHIKTNAMMKINELIDFCSKSTNNITNVARFLRGLMTVGAIGSVICLLFCWYYRIIGITCLLLAPLSYLVVRGYGYVIRKLIGWKFNNCCSLIEKSKGNEVNSEEIAANIRKKINVLMADKN